MNEREASNKLTVYSNHIQALISNTDEKIKLRLITCLINLIRFPNSVTLFYIDFARNAILDQSKDQNQTSFREALVVNILARMDAEGPQAWGLTYLVKQLQIHKKDISISKKHLELLWLKIKQIEW